VELAHFKLVVAVPDLARPVLHYIETLVIIILFYWLVFFFLFWQTLQSLMLSPWEIVVVILINRSIQTALSLFGGRGKGCSLGRLRVAFVVCPAWRVFLKHTEHIIRPLNKRV
jgi:hypothetical protein